MDEKFKLASRLAVIIISSWTNDKKIWFSWKQSIRSKNYYVSNSCRELHIPDTDFADTQVA
jgi:hypothetical protein